MNRRARLQQPLVTRQGAYLLLRCLFRTLQFSVLMTEYGVNVGEPLGAVKFLRHFSRECLQLQHPAPQIQMVIVEVAQLLTLGVRAEPATPPRSVNS